MCKTGTKVPFWRTLSRTRNSSKHFTCQTICYYFGTPRGFLSLSVLVNCLIYTHSYQPNWSKFNRSDKDSYHNNIIISFLFDPYLTLTQSQSQHCRLRVINRRLVRRALSPSYLYCICTLQIVINRFAQKISCLQHKKK